VIEARGAASSMADRPGIERLSTRLRR
jgi:hypothetical protein